MKSTAIRLLLLVLLLGWSSPLLADDNLSSQGQAWFDSLEAAEAKAEADGVPFVVITNANQGAL